MARVSVIIPNYNHGRYLPDRIESVLNQSVREMDVILLDDASTDDSAKIIKQYEDDPRIRVVVNETNSGSAFKQWNRGVALARTPYVWIAESDDLAEPEFLEVLLSKLEADSRLGLAYCRSVRINARGMSLPNMSSRPRDLEHDRWARDFHNNGRAECRYALIYENTIPNASAVVFRKSIYGQCGGADESMRLCGDWMMWAKMLLESDIFFSARALNRYRTHGASVRSHQAASVYGLAEQVAVQAFLADALDVDISTRHTLLDRIEARWYGAVMEAGRRVEWNDNVAVFHAAARIDRYEVRRLLWRLAMKYAWTSRPMLPMRAVANGWQRRRKR